MARTLAWDHEGGGCRYVAADAVAPRTVSLSTAALLAGACSALAAFATALALTPAKPPPPSYALAMEEVATPAPPSLAEQLFVELSAQEVHAVAQFASAKLGCNTSCPALMQGCWLSGSEAVMLHVPDKATALATLDAGAAAPPRMAEVIVVHADRPVEQGVGIYLVGPLDREGGLEAGASVRLLRSLHFNRRPVDLSDVQGDVATKRILRQLAPLLLESFGPIFPLMPESFDPEHGMAQVLYAPAVSSTLHRRVVRASFKWLKDPLVAELSWMHPLPFLFNLVQEGEQSEWHAVNVTYCGQMFTTVEELLASTGLQRCRARQATDFGWDVAGPKPGTAASRESLPVPPPINKTWEVAGRGSLRWGEWELFATVRPGSGMSLHDVRWRGERLLYEMGVNDAHAYYSSRHSANQFHYSDKAFSLTQLSGDMVLGLDCPVGASLIEGVSWLSVGGADVAEAKPVKLMCVYESNGEEGSLWRHTQLHAPRVSGRRHRSLVVRSVSTVGNYDYISEVAMGEDGSLHARNQFAGYPEMELGPPFRQLPPRRMSEAASWGSRVRGDLTAYLHAHFVAWKVDLDVLGQRNEFHTLRSGVIEPPGDLPKKVQHGERRDREDPDTLFRADSTKPGLWTITNPEAINRHTGTPRGYAVVMTSAPAVQTLPPEHPLSVTGSFARRHLAVARRKESEPTATHSMDHYPLDSPLLSVDNFLADRESLVGEDLVCWVSVGKEHITRAEDIPVVSNFAVSFALLPWNYAEGNPGMDLPMSAHP